MSNNPFFNALGGGQMPGSMSGFPQLLQGCHRLHLLLAHLHEVIRYRRCVIGILPSVRCVSHFSHPP